MNGQLPPIDPDLRAHLSRRSAGRLPDDLTSQVLRAVDLAPVKPRYSWRAFSPRPVVAVPRTLLAGAGVAAVLVLVAAALVVPRFAVTPAASGPAGYPADRALTTAELASVMAGPALPINTALVATVTIDAKNDVCPMDRYPTIGVVEGMGSQVCVMGELAARFSARSFDPRFPGTYAFRYLAPGYLGLLGEITPASSSKLAFRVVDDWPLAVDSFLVEGWLGADETVVPCASLQTSGDVLSPDGDDCPYDNWLSDEQTASPADFPGPQPKRLVEAGGMRQIDSVDHAAPVHGVYVVRGVVEQCPNASPQDNRGCATWRVLARVAAVPAPLPTSANSATPTAGPPATPIPGNVWNPADRPLTTAELVRAMAAGIPKDQVVVAQVTFATMNGCPGLGSYQPIGLLASTSLCVVGIGDGDPNHSPVDSSQSPVDAAGVFAFRVLDSTTLGFMATINATVSPDDSWPAGKTILVTGWLDGASGVYSCRMIGALSNEPLDPGGVPCGQYWISSDEAGGVLRSAEPAGVAHLWLPDYPQVGGGLLPLDGVRATYLVRDENRCASAASTDPSVNTAWNRLCGWQIMARVDPMTIPAEPSAAPAASSLAPTGLMGSGNRPLTQAEFETLWAADPAHLAGRIAIVKGPVPAGFECSGVATTNAQATPPACVANIVDGQIALDGYYWAVRVGVDGMLSVIGQLSTPTSGFVLSLDQAWAKWKAAGADKQLFLVDAWIGGAAMDSCDIAGQPCYEVSWLGSTADAWLEPTPNAQQVPVQLGAYHAFGGGSVGGGAAIHGIFLVMWIPTATACGTGDLGTGPCPSHAEIVARMEAATVP